MLVGLKAPKSVLQLLEDAPFEFHLTGSRLLFPSSVVNGETDWDFFVENTKGLGHWLVNNGFNTTDNPNYADEELLALYEQGDVDIQIRPSAENWLRKQKILLSIPEKTRALMVGKHNDRGHISRFWESL